MALHPVLDQVTRRIQERSRASRSDYLAQVDAMAARPPQVRTMGCANVAHAFAALPGTDKIRIVEEKGPNVGIVTAYNDVLSAHAPFAHYPDILKDEARRNGATAQVAGGVPAMCDGVTQGMPGMELSLFSRDTIAMSTAVALT
jgi:phosphogluconate dehydratase